MPAPPVSFPGQEGARGTNRSAGSCCSGIPQMPLTCSSAPEGFPWSRARQGSSLPNLCPLPHQPQHTQHCPYSPLQISLSFSRLRFLRCCPASPRHRPPVRPLAPQHAPSSMAPGPASLAARPPPPQQGDPREGQYLRGGGTEQGCHQVHLRGQGRGREAQSPWLPRPCTGQWGFWQPQCCPLLPVQRLGLGPGCQKRDPRGCGSPMNLTAASRKVT